MQDMTEHFISRESIFEGRVLHVVRDRVLLPNGSEATREMCLHVGAVAVLPLYPDGTVLMERQFRYPHHRHYLEIPAGKREHAEEDPLAAAARELWEETGATAERYTDLGWLDTSPAILDERIRLYLAEGLTLGERRLDEDEFLTVERIPLTRLLDMVMAGEIRDAKTQVAVLKVARLRPQFCGFS